MIWLPLLLLGVSTIQAADNSAIPAQAARGKVIFTDKAAKNHCATCHELDKAGTAIGPNLVNIAKLSPKGIEISIMSSRTVHAKEIELKSKEKMAAMVVSETPKDLTLYNLSVSPPERLVVEKDTIYAVRDNGTWRHPPEAASASKETLADVIAYIRFVAFGDTKGVKPEELE